MEHAIMCPQCSAPLAPHRFARSTVCSYCGATVQLDEASVSAEIFHQAFRVWNAPMSHQISSWISFGESHWGLDQCIARGDISDVYTGRRARCPTELVVIKVLRDGQDSKLFENEWEAIQILQRSDARGAETFTALIPQPVLHGDAGAGLHAGQRVSIFRWESGFRHTLEEVIQAYPQGIPARASIWIWRRILETLSFIHASGMAHGAVLPQHLLIQDNEHGIRLVGYSRAGHQGDQLLTSSSRFESYYPHLSESPTTLTAQLDLVMSARCIAAVLGGNPTTATLPATVPAALAGIVQRIALADPSDGPGEDAWTIREELGEVARDVFGPPRFIPIMMPS
jgi:hypothetical protein